MFNKTVEADLEKAKETNYEGLIEGQAKVLWLYNITKTYYDSEILVINEIVWEENYASMNDYMKEVNINAFIVINQSTELKDLLWFFAGKGFNRITSVEVTRKGNYGSQKENGVMLVRE